MVRQEYDSLGTLDVCKDTLYGIQTVRSSNNFYITNKRISPYMIKALGLIKKSALIINNESNYIDDEKSKYILLACEEVIENKLDEYFITDVIQGGAGTSINMNANEVIANRAAQLANKELGKYDFIHPNDHINFSQSTNDVFPTAGKLTSLFLVEKLLIELNLLIDSLQKKSIEFEDIIKIGRTHLQDAVPITLGQEFKAYSSVLKRDVTRIEFAFDALKVLNLGATAIGTGINADVTYSSLVVKKLSEISGFDLSLAEDLIDATRNLDSFVFCSSTLKTLSVSLSKMCNDIRIMASGPKAGLSEILLPERQPGSSIMPGKVNPVIPEVVNQVCFQVFGNDLTITKAAEAGQLELNVFEPVLFKNLFESIEYLTNACNTLRINCIENLEANVDGCKLSLEMSVGISTALVPHIGYANAAKCAKRAIKENRKLQDIVLESKLLTKEELEKILDVNAMTHAGIVKIK